MRRADRATVLAFIRDHPGSINSEIVEGIYGNGLDRYDYYLAKLWITGRISELHTLGQIEPLAEVERGKPHAWRCVRCRS